MNHRNEGLVSGKSVVVTGGAAGIGEAISKVFARHGARVLVNGLPGDPVDEVVGEIRKDGGTAAGCAADVGTPEGARACVEAAVDSFGKLDVLIANAAVFPEQAEVQDYPIQAYEETLRSNISGVFFTVQAALPHLHKTAGVVLAASSEAGLLGFPESAPYAASKGWIISFIRSVAVEQAKRGVRANIVAPGAVDTEMTRPSKGKQKVKNVLMGLTATPLGRRGTPEEIANVYLFLASDLATFMTGSTVVVDGGVSISHAVPGLQADRRMRKAPPGTVELRHQYQGRGTLH